MLWKQGLPWYSFWPPQLILLQPWQSFGHDAISSWKLKSILGTDLDTSSLNRASQGVYTDSSLREVPEEILHRWFREEKGLWKLDTRVQQMVRFRHHHFMKDPLPGEMDLVFARYLPFTYYQGIRRHTAAQRLWLALRPGGALMIGCKEDLGLPERDLFEPWPDTEGFFCKKSRTLALKR